MIGRIGRLKSATILVLLLSLCLAQNVTKLTLNDLQEFSIVTQKGGKAYFTATISEKEDNEDLIVQLNCLSIDSDPDLIVYLNLDQKPSSKNQPYCTSDQIGYDVCLINSEHIKSDMNILVEVSCQTACKYSLNLIYKDKIEYNTEKGGKIDVIYKETEIREFLLKIPKSKNKPSNMLIEAEFKNMYSFEYKDQIDFDVFGDQGKKTPQTKQNSKHHSIWINDSIKAIPFSEQNLCTDCYFSVAVKAPKGAIIQFSAVIYDNERELNLSQYLTNGVVEKGEIQYFTIEFDDLLDYERSRIFSGTGRNQIFSASLLFNLIPYNGDPNLYIYYGEKRPDSLDKFSWQSVSQFRQDLILISSDELNKIGYSTKNKIFIAVHGVELSAYQMRVDIYTEDGQQNINLSHAQPVTGYVGKNKLTNYSFRVEGSMKRTIEIQLTSLAGNPDLFVKKWKYGDGSEQLIKNEDINDFFKDINNKNNPFIGWSINKQGVDTVKVKYDPEECMNPNFPDKNNDGDDDKDERNLKTRPNYDMIYYNYCVFQIAVYGNDENNRYILKTVSNEPDSIMSLRENQPQYTYLEQLDSKYFSFRPMTLDVEIQSVRIQLFYSSGFASISGDRDLEKLKAKKPEKDYVSSMSNHYIEYKQEDLKQGERLCDFTYFVLVNALERTNAQIKVEIVRNGAKQVSYTELIMGFQTKLVLGPKKSSHFKLQYMYNQMQTIVARGDSSIQMFIGLNPNIPPSNFQNKYDADKNIASSSTTKRIDIDDGLEIEDSYLYGTIENTSDKEITVILQGQSQQVNIELNNTIEDILIPNVQRTYYFNIYPDIVDEKIYAYVIPSGTVLEQKLTGHFMINNKYIATFRDNDPIKYFYIEQSLLKKECPHLFEENKWQDCQFKLEVKSTQEERLVISINAPEKPSYISYYGQTLSQLPLKGEIRKFLYYMYGAKEFILTVQSYSYDFQVLGKIINYSQFQSNNAINGNFFPTLDDDHKKISIYTDPNIIHQIRFQPETYKGESCQDGCFLMISIVLPKDSAIEDKNIFGNIIKLNIIGDKIYDLQQGESMMGQVDRDEMIYYRIFVPPDMNSQRLVVNLTPLDNGDPDMFLNKDSVKLPTRSEHDLSSQDIAGDFILVEKDSIKGQKGIAGYYIVGIYGGTKATYTIQFQTGPYAIHKIEKDSIQQVTLTHKSQLAYFVYHKRDKGFFTVVTNMSQGSTGDSYLFIKQYQNEVGKVKDFLDKLANPNEADITTKHDNHKEYLRYDKNDCDDCTYIIGVKADRRVSFSISLTLDDGIAQVQNNKQHLMFLRQNKTSKLNFFSQTDFNLYVTAYSGHCVSVKVNYGVAIKKTIYSKDCKSDPDTKAQGYDSFYIFVEHPDKEAANSGGLYYASLFSIELMSSFGDEKVVIQGVSGNEARLIAVGVPLEQEIDPAKGKVAQFIYYSSHEELQSVQVHLSAEPGQEDCLTFTDQEMKISDSTRVVVSTTIAHTKQLLAKSYLTHMNLPYILEVHYKGTRKFKFSILLKETNPSNIPILSGFVMDILPISETSNYLLYVQKSQNILIQNFNCVSDQNIFVYTNLVDLIAQNSKAERVTRKATSNHEIQIMDIADKNLQSIYIQKRANKQTKEKLSKSLITTETFQKNDPIIYNYIQIGDSGIISSIVDYQNITILFQDIECIEVECERVKGLLIGSIEYTLHVAASREDLQRQSNCLIQEKSDLKINDIVKPIKINGFYPLMKQETRLFQFEKILLPDGLDKIYVTVSAKVQTSSGSGNNSSYRFIYGTIMQENINFAFPEIEKKSSEDLGILIAICVVSIVVLILVIVSLYRRYKNVHNKLKYEMSDVRNIAHSDIEHDAVPESREYNSILPDKKQSEMIELR